MLEQVIPRTKRLLQRIRRIWEYIQLAWYDDDWDYSYTLKILKYKLIRQKRELERNPNYVGVEKDIKDLTICINLLTRILEDDYLTEDDIEHFTNWWVNRKEVELDDGWTRVEFKIDPAHERKSNQINSRIESQKKLDWDLLFKLLHKHMKSWWN